MLWHAFYHSRFGFLACQTPPLLMAAMQATGLEASVAALRALVPIILPMATGDEVLARFHALDAYATSAEPRVDVLPPSLRDRAVRHMERMLHLLGCEPTFLFKAVNPKRFV